MSKIKQIVPEDVDTGHSDHFYAPGELETTIKEELEKAAREWELSKYSTQELEMELLSRKDTTWVPF